MDNPANEKKSFSINVRKELCAIPFSNRHCVLAELSAMIHASVENKFAANRFKQLLLHAFNVETINDIKISRQILKATAYPMSVTQVCCKKAYTRGSFLGGGTLNNPDKSYHLEFALPLAKTAQHLRDILRFFKLKPKITRRKSQSIVYLKESDAIALALNLMGAHKSMLQFENTRILKEMRNDVNRKVNFETANLNKTVNAAINQIDDIQFIAQTVGLGFLSKPLEEAARLRLMYETASLQEIGAMLNPPVGKSGVNHRLRKISKIAGELQKKETLCI
jgi:hypothetical protein